MTPADEILYKTRKTALDAATELGHNNVNDLEITLDECTSCGIWLRKDQLIPDLDKNLICGRCADHYGL